MMLRAFHLRRLTQRTEPFHKITTRFGGLASSRCISGPAPRIATVADSAPIQDAGAADNTSSIPIPFSPPLKPIRKLPAHCTGCGAFTQTTIPDQPGYFDLARKTVRLYLGLDQPRGKRKTPKVEAVSEEVGLTDFERAELERLGVETNMISLGGKTPPPTLESDQSEKQKTHRSPLCDRCHDLIYHEKGVSVFHPSVESIQDTLAESPYKYNHVYHVLDAADFPMSILPKIHEFLDEMPIRSRNRRSKPKYFHGQKTELSFIITRSDLLAPTKEQVDRLMPYLREVLRSALGRSGRDFRLGNVRCVSSRRSWWTKQLKEEIWKRGGGGWMVGKVNVGKSLLFDSVFPKGRLNQDTHGHQITIRVDGSDPLREVPVSTRNLDAENPADPLVESVGDDGLDELALLPPAPPEELYPEMPIASSLPGTTASPIRVPFGNGRGELIDLPGLERSTLEHHVQAEHRESLIMRHRIVPEQHALKDGRSLLLGGFIRITPRPGSPVVLAYAFTPLEDHLTSTEKAKAIQAHESDLNIDNISVPGTGAKIKHAGAFELKWDVTRPRTGPLTRNDAIGLDPERLPYVVLGADILIEGIGWVELVAQVRKRDFYAGSEPGEEEVEQVVSLNEWNVPMLNHGIDTHPPESESTQNQPESPASPEFNPATAFQRLEALGEAQTRASKPKKPPPPPPPRAPSMGSRSVEEGQKKDAQKLNFPIVDVYTPEGKYVSSRMCMNGWLLNKPLIKAKHRRSRPRRSMKGAKKLEKTRRRAREDGRGGGLVSS